jgi:hypothetical protein
MATIELKRQVPSDLTWTRRGRNSFAAALVGCVLLPALVVIVTGPAAQVAIAVLAAGFVVMAVVILTIGIGRSGSPGIVVDVQPEQLEIRYGHRIERVDRQAVARGEVGRWVKLVGPDGGRVAYVPLKPKRDEVLNELRRQGWPVSDTRGMQRH